MGSSRTRLLTFGIGAVILGAMVGTGHVLWTRSADSEIVHYSWPVKWALTFAAESPDLPAGSRFTAVTVRNASDGAHWTVTGELELPSNDGRRLVTSYEATIRSQCPDVAARRCWAMDRLILGSVPAAVATPSDHGPPSHGGPPLEIAAVTPAVVELTPAPEPFTPQARSEAEQDEDLAFILTERLVEPGAPLAQSDGEQDEDLAFILVERLVEPADDALATLDDGLQIPKPHAAGPRYDPTLVRDIQSGLAALGYDPGPVDGIPGRQTHAAIESFRAREGLASAAIGFDLLDEIARRLSYSEPAPAPVPPPAELPPPQEMRKQPWACTTVNSKNRDCGV